MKKINKKAMDMNIQFFATPNKPSTKIETRLEVVNEVDKDVAELYLYGTIAKKSWWDDEAISASGVRDSLKGLENKNLKVHLNSGGGDVFESIAIHNLLKQYEGQVTISIDGLAGSGASVIAMAGDKVLMPSNSMVMVHKASTYTYGNSTEFRKIADDLDKIDTSVRESYKARFVGEEQELIDLIEEETWLTAEECLAFGFCDEILTETKEEPIENSQPIKVSLFEKYKVVASATDGGRETLLNKFKTGGNK